MSVIRERGRDPFQDARHIAAYRFAHELAMKHFHWDDAKRCWYIRKSEGEPRWYLGDSPNQCWRNTLSALDVGCGPGYGAAYLQNEFGYDVLGIDPDERAIRSASKLDSFAEFKMCPDWTLGLMSHEDFDIVTCFQVIEHRKDYLRLIIECWKHTAPGGLLFITTPKSRLEPGEKPWNIEHVQEWGLLGMYDLKKLLTGKVIGNAPVIHAVVGIVTSPSVATWLAPDEILLYGIQAGGSAWEYEQSRILAAKKKARLDPLRLRRFLPDVWRYRLSDWITPFVGGVDERFPKEYLDKTFILKNAEAPTVLDFMLVLKKGV